MTAFDTAILLFLNRFSRLSWTLDHAIVFVSESNLLKGGALVATLWSLWFVAEQQRERVRGHVIGTIAAALVAIAVARTLALTLPFRLRPIHDPRLDFTAPWGVREGLMESWSAFPSDHAVLFFALAAGMMHVSWNVGLLAAAWAFFVIALPRMYLGLHYPTDILVGAVLGAMIAVVINHRLVLQRLMQPVRFWIQRSPASFYGVIFLLLLQMSILFRDVRDIGSFVYHMILIRS